MNLATDFSSFEKALRIEGITSFNIIYADKTGNIYYQSNGAYPLKDPRLNWRNPIKTNTSQMKWTALLPFEKKPAILNPECGYVFNANNTPLECTGDTCDWEGYFPGLQLFTYNRGERLDELLQEQVYPLSWKKLLDIKFEKKYHPSGSFVDRFKNVFNLSSAQYPHIAQAIIQYKNWNLDNTIENKEATLAMLTHYFLKERMKMPFAYLMIREQPIPEEDAVWALTQSQKLLRKKFGTLEVPLGQAQRHIRGKVSYPVGGAYEVLRATSPHLYNKPEGLFRNIGGDGYIQMIRFSKDGLPEIETVNAYGSSARPESPHYTDQMLMFVEERFKTMTLKKEEILKSAKIIYYPGELYYR